MNDSQNSVARVPLVALLGLIVVVFLLQQVMLGVRERVVLEGNQFKWMVVANQVISILLPVVLFIAVLRLRWKNSLGLFKPPWVKMLVAIASGFVLIYAVNTILPTIIPPGPVYTEATSPILAFVGVWGLLLTVFTISVVAPLADELLFRGLVLRVLLAKYGPVAAVLLVGTLTALFHTLEPFKLVHSFLMGVLFACAVVWTGSLWTSIALHALHNSLAFLPQ
ncbi:MAG: CPBP family intramembrane metalloprotease [Gemmatimonadota bacterium]|nr:MAG: CPBP family intramembrane metalloprotease [Gemmatimonadota bacterium]